MRISKLFIVFLLIFQVSGCATHANQDPLEGFNRAIYKFNDVADGAIIKPVSKGYKNIAPTFVVKGINNFFNNIRDVVTVINELLQGKIKYAANDTGRVIVNSTIGLLGFIDVHSINGGERRKEDFGQTLGYWGVGQGAYLVLPFIGPSTTRDAVGFVTDTLAFDPISYINNVRGRNQLRIIQFIDARTELLNASSIMDEASLDPYAFQRDAYLQYREALVQDKPSGDIDYSDSADADYNYEAYTEEFNETISTENSKTQKISQAE
ncbi:VacJ family lipoprotein [Methylophilaceae bacterium]|nr:VacJ family lipoprotein [Methylophilaceae bacterium]|tara:strand:- start:1162 stop:1959 length:798 start_codon:yes stop_codon:yes gene_type:complete